jgi:hypothetical protein
MIEDAYEKLFKKCNGMSAVRKVAEAYEQMVIIDPLAEGCAERDDALVDGKQKEQQEYEELLKMKQHEDERVLEEKDLLLLREHQNHQDHPQGSRGRYDIDMTGWDDDGDEGNDDVREARTSVQSTTQPDRSDVEKETTHITNPFIDSYMKSIRPARDVICDQWSECSWYNKNLNIEPPANDDEVKSHGPYASLPHASLPMLLYPMPIYLQHKEANTMNFFVRHICR